jgi:fructokinase
MLRGKEQTEAFSPLDTRTLRRRHVSGKTGRWNHWVVIVICGEAIVDLVPDPSTPSRYLARPGGSSANTAVALARLGTPVAMLARLSSDRFGELLRAHLAGNGVDLSVAVAASEPSSLAIATVGGDGGADYRFLVAGTADWGWTDTELGSLPKGTAAVHGGSLALALAPGGAAVERMLVRARGSSTVSLDPNIRPSLIADMSAHRDTVERCVAAADVVKVSREDLDALHPGQHATDVARRWARTGPALVVVTAGGDGSIAVTAETEVACPASPVTVVDTIGAGDTFAAALLDWLYRAGRLGGRLTPLAAADIDAALRHASRAAAITCSRTGADPPYRDELVGTASP